MIKFPALMVGILLSAALVRPSFGSEEVGFVSSSGEHNKALIVGVPHNLKGIDIDIKNWQDVKQNCGQLKLVDFSSLSEE